MNIAMNMSGRSGLGYAVLATVAASTVVEGVAGRWWRRRSGWGHGSAEAGGGAPVFTKTAAYLFLGLLVVIVAAADAGQLPRELRVLYDYPNGDRLGHVVIFGILAFLFSAAFRGALKMGRWVVPAAVVALLIFATVEEVSQQWFPSRNFDPMDLVCSYAGIALGGWAGARWRRREGRLV